MTTDIEEQFYKTFGIEPKKLCFNGDCAVKDEIGYDEKICDDRCIYIEREYPEITSDILLQLLCIVIDEYNHNGHTFYLDAKNIEELKSDILDALMGCIDATSDLFDDRVKQVQSLFTEVGE